MPNHDGAPRPAELVYVSESKLFGLARAHNIAMSWFERETAFEGTGRLAVPLLPGASLSVKASAKAQRVHPEQREEAIENLLDRVVRTIEKDGIADLEALSGDLDDARWFRFHRRLRFGVGASEYDSSLRSLIMVDREAVAANDVIPGLLMFGSPAHLRPPYFSEKLANSPGGRSGSETGTLFGWLRTADQAFDDPQLNLDSMRADRRLEASNAPESMYRLFAQDNWMANPRFPEIVNHAPCEGVARATFVAPGDTRTVVMASPLYVRVRAMPPVRRLIDEAPQRGLLARFAQRRADTQPDVLLPDNSRHMPPQLPCQPE
jgi:hypothetical protein